MNDQEKEGQLEGIVQASRYDPSAQGKQFLGAAIECSERKVWVIDYDEQSPFHAFTGRQVVASGEPYQPEGQHLIDWGGGKKLGHFRVSTMRLKQVTADAKLVEVGAAQELSGLFQRGMSESGDSTLSFVTDEGDTFLVLNHPAGMTVGRRVEVRAYPVQRPPSNSRPAARYLWVICPCSAADIWEWRRDVTNMRNRND